MTFTLENTRGYTPNELHQLNEEWEQIVIRERLEPETDEYYQREKHFHNSVSKWKKGGCVE